MVFIVHRKDIQSIHIFASKPIFKPADVANEYQTQSVRIKGYRHEQYHNPHETAVRCSVYHRRRQLLSYPIYPSSSTLIREQSSQTLARPHQPFPLLQILAKPLLTPVRSNRLWSDSDRPPIAISLSGNGLNQNGLHRLLPPRTTYGRNIVRTGH
jgi:hypothetical protein